MLQDLRSRLSVVVFTVLSTLIHLASAQAGVVGHWRFEDAAPTADSGPNGLDLSLSGSGPMAGPVAGTSFPATLPSGSASNAGLMNFGTTQTGHFTKSDDPVLTLANFTIEAFARLGQVTPTTQYVASQWTYSDTSQRSWGFGVAGSSPPSGLEAGEIFMVVSGDGAVTTVVGSGLKIAPGEDVHLAASLDLGQGIVTFLRTDLTSGESAVAVRDLGISLLHDSTDNFLIGAFNNGSSRWTGLLDEVRLQDEAGATLLTGLPAASPVTFSPAGGLVDEPVEVSISSPIPGGEVRFTTDGNDPTPGSSLYQAPIGITETTELRARVFLEGVGGPVMSATYIFTPPVIARIVPRHAREIESSNFSIGAETMDRDFTIYDHWKRYLGPLGAKKARIQSGWAKTEKVKGEYDFAWLDAIVDDMVAQGVEPWITICYGNTLYEGGGDEGLGGGLPTSATALAAWDAYVAALVTRYQDRVDEWEVWNEPENGGLNPATQYADFLIRTAGTVRAIQPDAQILGGAYTGGGIHSYNTGVMDRVEALGKLHLIDQMTYHPYTRNPDSNYGSTLAFRDRVKNYDPRIEIRQGENGAPSRRQGRFALSGYDWTELTQAKWMLRRQLGDLGRDIETSHFSMMEMDYTGEDNSKGLLALPPSATVDRPNEDKTVHHVKVAYYALQNMLAIFDHSLQRIPGFSHVSAGSRSISAFAYEQGAGGGKVVSLWFDDQTPSDSNLPTPVDLDFAGVSFEDPVRVDLLTGDVFAISPESWRNTAQGSEFDALAVYDSPVLVAERVVVLPPKAVWKNTHFTPDELIEHVVAGDASDPDGDGYDNHFEWLFAMNPRAVDRPVLEASRETDGSFSVTYRRPEGGSDEVETQVSTDLVAWSAPAAGMTETVTLVAGEGVESVRLGGLRPVGVENPSCLFVRFERAEEP